MIEDGGLDDLPTEFQRVEMTDVSVSFRVAVIRGIDSGSEIVIRPDTPGRVLVGTGPACALRLHDPRISRRHVALEVSGARLRVSDLGSTNGTRLNGIGVVEAYASGGESLAIGDAILAIARDGPEPGRVDAPVREGFGLTVGASPQMQRLYSLCDRLAASDVPLVIEGETGTGKEVLAQSIHMMGPRAAGPFVVFDCTSVPVNLMEAELFGHDRGAFTGAVTTRKGVFEQAEGGTLLIDEIGDLDLSLQPKLLRAVERKQIRRLGGSAVASIDVRLIAATRRDLDREVLAHRFRDDLFHRLAVARVELPPLRDRSGDIRVLARHFFEELGVEAAEIPAHLLRRWEDASWPGNLRELKNAVARWVALGEAESKSVSGTVSPNSDHGNETMDWAPDLRLPFTEARQRLVDAFERTYLQRMLDEHGGNVSRAAAAAGIGRRYFHMLLARSTPR